MKRLSKGENIAIPTIAAEVRLEGTRLNDADLIAFCLNSDGRIVSDNDMVFYNQRVSSDQSVRLTDQNALVLHLPQIRSAVETIAIAVSLDDDFRGPLASIPNLMVRATGMDWSVEHLPTGLTSERCLILLEFYRRAGAWKIRAVSQGWAQGFTTLVSHYGVTIEDEPTVAPAPSPPALNSSLPIGTGPVPVVPVPHVAPSPIPNSPVPPRTQSDQFPPLPEDTQDLITLLGSAPASQRLGENRHQIPHVDRRLYRTQRDYAAARRHQATVIATNFGLDIYEFSSRLSVLPTNPTADPRSIYAVATHCHNSTSGGVARRWLSGIVGRSQKQDRDSMLEGYWTTVNDLFTRSQNLRDSEAVTAWIRVIVASAQIPSFFGHVIALNYSSQDKRVVVDIEAPARDFIPRYKTTKYTASVDNLDYVERPQSEITAATERLFAMSVVAYLHVLACSMPIQIIVNVIEMAINPATGATTPLCRATGVGNRAAVSPLDLARIDPVACLRSVLGGDVSSSEQVQRRAAVGTAPRRTGRSVNLLTMDPFQFEHLVCELVQRMGYANAQVTPRSGDGGIDVIAHSTDPLAAGKIVISVKRYRNTVPPDSVRALANVVSDNGAIKGILVTTSKFGPASYEVVRGKNLDLVDGPRLREWLASYLDLTVVDH